MSSMAQSIIDRLCDMPIFFLVRILAACAAESDWQRKDLHATTEGYRLVLERDSKTVEILFRVLA